MLTRGLVTAAAVVLSGCAMGGAPVGPLEHDTKVIELDQSETTRLELKMQAGELRVEGGSPKLLEADFFTTTSAPGSQWSIIVPPALGAIWGSPNLPGHARSATRRTAGT